MVGPHCTCTSSLLSSEACLGIGFDLVPAFRLDWWWTRQKTCARCVSSSAPKVVAFTPFIIIEMAFTDYGIEENTGITFEKSKRQEGSTKLHEVVIVIDSVV